MFHFSLYHPINWDLMAGPSLVGNCPWLAGSFVSIVYVCELCLSYPLHAVFRYRSRGRYECVESTVYAAESLSSLNPEKISLRIWAWRLGHRTRRLPAFSDCLALTYVCLCSIIHMVRWLSSSICGNVIELGESWEPQVLFTLFTVHIRISVILSLWGVRSKHFVAPS